MTPNISTIKCVIALTELDLMYNKIQILQIEIDELNPHKDSDIDTIIGIFNREKQIELLDIKIENTLKIINCRLKYNSGSITEETIKNELRTKLAQTINDHIISLICKDR